MQRRNRFVSICLILALFLVFPFPLRADEAAISCFVTNNATHLLVYARVTNCFTKDMEAAILAGVPTTFTFLVDLYQERRRWLDKKLIRLTVRHTIKYDNRQKTLLCLLRWGKGTDVCSRIMKAPSGRWPI